MAFRNASLKAEIGLKRQTGELAPRDQELRPASEYSKYLLDHGPAVLFAAKPNGSYPATYVSANVERVFGYTAQDFMTPGFFLSRIHPQDLPHCREKLGQLFRDGLSHLEFRFRHGDGRYRWVRDDVRVVRDAAGNPLEIVGVATDITPEKEAEAELQESRLQAAAISDALADRLRRKAELLDLAFDAIIVRDLGNRVVFWNNGAEKQYGWTKAEAGGRDGDILLQTRYPEPLGSIKDVLLQQGYWDGELVHIRRDGTPIAVASRWALQRDTDGGPRAVLEINRDVTPQKQAQEAKKKAEEALRFSENRLSLIDDTASDLLFLIRVEAEGVCRVLKVSRSYVETSGIKQEDVVGKTPAEVLPEAHARYVIGKYEEALRLKRSIRYEETIHTKDEARYCETTLTPLVDEKGEFTYLLGVIHDVTERKLAEEARMRLEERFNKAFHSSPDMMAIVRLSDDYFIDINDNALATLGYRREEVIGRTVQDIGLWPRPEDGEKVSAEIIEKGRCRDLEVSCRMKTGELRDGLLSAELIEVAGEQCVLATVRDITEQKRTESEWLRLDRLNLVGEMAAGIAHEIRNPMTSVRGFLQLFQEKPEYAGHRASFNLMIGELDRANAIITEFLSLAKDRKMELEPRDLRRTLEALLPLLAAEAVKSDKQVDAELVKVPRVLFNEREICQLVLNLAKNGLEAMAPGGRLGLKLAQEGGQVVLSVADTGGGIRPDLLDRLGTPFLTTKDHGTGLGLPVCYRIAERHGARLTVDTGPRGTTFNVRFKPHERQQ